MAMPVDDQWPSLAPIRTSTAAASTDKSNAAWKIQNVEEGSHGGRKMADNGASSGFGAAHFDASSESHQLSRHSPCCHTNKNSSVHFFSSCFSCAKSTSSPQRRHCTPTCMQRSRPALRSMAFSFPAGGIQSFHSSTPAKAQLSGALPLSLSGKAQHYASPRTPTTGAGLNRQLSSKIQHFSSPRTPGSGANHHYLSTPRTPSSGKVQHFSGAIPSPRTPFSSSTTSPSSARRKKASFTLIIPPTMAHNKKAADQPDEPTSPHVTCIGRVRRQTQCKKLHHTDMISPHTQCKDNITKKKAATSKKPHYFSDVVTCHSISSSKVTKSSSELSTMEACTQRFGREKLNNLHKIHGFHNEATHDNVLFEADGGSPNCNQGDDTPPMAYCGKVLVHLDPQTNGRHISLNDTECITENMRNLQKADHDHHPANIHTD
eukprot:c5155_g1_i1 orf=73-1368(+)